LRISRRRKIRCAQPARERLSLDRGWLFHEGDIPFPVISGHQASYDNAKAGSSSGAASPEFDDSSWKEVNLPHDWAVEQPFDQKANLAEGYRARGMGWYRKYFRLDPADHGKHLELQLDGVATHCTVWVNGVLSACNWSGYNSIYIDITPIAKYGNELNTIAVQVDAIAQEGWWYEGSGLYRHAWLVKRNPVHIETDGVFANPIRGADGKWSIPVETTLYSSDKTAARVEVESTLIDPAGKPVVSGKTMVSVEPLKEQVAKFSVAVKSPKLWSVDEPTLYSVRTVVKRDGAVVDEVTTHCGFRTIRFDADKGFFLNDKPLKLLGTANHQDHAGVGVAVPDALWDYRVRLLKELGSNAYRASHNAPAAEFLDACDRLGMLVMDENPVDFSRNPVASDPQFLSQYMSFMADLIERDRDHPSVILWGLDNESDYGSNVEATFKYVRAEDPRRAAQFSWASQVPVDRELPYDVFSFHYPSFNEDLAAYGNSAFNPHSLVLDRKPQPRIPVLADEFAHLPIYDPDEWRRDPNVHNFWGESIKYYWEKMFATEGALGGDIFGLPGGRTSLPPEYWLIKKAYSPVRVDNQTLVNPGPGKPLNIPVKNWFDHTALSELKVHWSVGNESGDISGPAVAPHAAGQLKIPARKWRNGDVCASSFSVRTVWLSRNARWRFRLFCRFCQSRKVQRRRSQKMQAQSLLPEENSRLCSAARPG